MKKNSGVNSRSAAVGGARGEGAWLVTAFAALAELSDDLIAMLDFDGRIVSLNAVGRRMAGLDARDDVTGQDFATLLPPAAAQTFRAAELPAVKDSGQWRGESQLAMRGSESLADLVVHSFVIEDPQTHERLGIATLRRNITEHKRRESSLRTSEERFRQLAENIEEVFWISEFDPRKILYASPAYEKIFGAPGRELYDDPDAFLKRIDPEDLPRIIESLPRVRQGGYDETFRMVRPDGAVRVIRSRAFPVRNEAGEVYRVAGIAGDITEAKQVEEELLAERRFLHHLLAVQEGERKLVAYDIHDGFLQGVIGAAMHLEALMHDATLAAGIREKLSSSIDLLRHSIDEARRMIEGLRPPVLDKQGLVAGIEFLVGQRSDSTTRIEFHHNAIDARLDPIIEGTIYRIAQEALSNVFRHSQAQTATVSLAQRSDRLELSIEDQGQGFDPQKVPPGHFGLRGIRERAQLCGGLATIESQLGRGTRVRVDLPLSQSQSPSAGA
jgi:PAS domain S-box-containing protein